MKYAFDDVVTRLARMRRCCRCCLYCLGCLMFSCVMLPRTALACAILDKEQAEQQGQQFVAEFKRATLALREQADLIFTGRLQTLDVAADTGTLPDARQQGRQRYAAVFERVDDIKGRYLAGQVLSFSVDRQRVTVPVGCRLPFWLLPKENGVGERYLVYVRDGIILRTNRIPSDVQTMDGNAEQAFMRDLPD